MPKKKTKKKYVNKKRAKTYTLMRRGIDDPEYDETSESTHYMLYPTNNKAIAAENERREREEYEADMAEDELDLMEDDEDEDITKKQMAETSASFIDAAASRQPRLLGDKVDVFGFPLDGYDYSQHMRASGGGVFVTPDGRTMQTPGGKGKMSDLADIFAPVEGGDADVEAITIETKDLPEDVRKALEASDSEDFEEFELLQEDFVMAASEVAPSDAAKAFETKRAMLRKMVDTARDRHEDEDAELMAEMMRQMAMDAGNMGSRPDTKAMQMMDKQFDVLMQKYDEDNWGELLEEENEEGDEEEDPYELDNKMVEDALQAPGATNAFIAGKLDTVVTQVPITPEEATKLLPFRLDPSGLPEGQLIPTTKSVFDVTEETRDLLPVVDPEITRKLAEAMEEEDDLDSHPWLGKGDDKPKEKWDCESIVSTYSNLEHHPTLIKVAKRVAKKTVDKPVLLSRKTGMPVHEEDDADGDDDADADGDMSNEEFDDGMSTASSIIAPRRKGETKEEKKRRKAEAKARARERRAEKKMNKLSFKAEKKRLKKSSANASQYRTRFKY